MANYSKALKTLEYYKILEMLAECSPTDGSKDMALRLTPSDDIVRIQRLLDQTSDAKMLAGIKGQPSFSGVKDINPSLERASKGAMLSPRELLDIAVILRTSRRLLDYINGDKRFDTSIDVNFERLEPNRALEEKITRAIIAEDMIADEASPALADIRRKIRNASGKVKDVLQKYTSGVYGKYLQENIVTMRGGRYVVPVKVEYKNEVKGLVHDTSSSGATLFVEPFAVVEVNNELRELEANEKHEIDRILTELSGECADFSASLSLDYYNITELAFIFARAELSLRMNAFSPKLNKDREIRLYNARHPLLDPKKVVPITLSLGGNIDTLVITGPNTGGKTVTLKTIGLLTLMAQSGLHIPCDDTSSVCVFDEVLADIGDEQSIEQSLSTFSGHMVNIVEITKESGPASLVLFDELGAGTDPVEGAALATSILEYIRDSGAVCAATTHYAELKAYALETEGVTNASCEFDIETLRPTYRLIIGTPGKSNAFAISQKLGLGADIIESAKEHLSNDSKRFEYVIEKLETSRIQMEQEREHAEKLRREFENYRAEAERKLNRKIADTEKELEKSRAQAVQLVEGARVTSEYVMAQLEEVKRKRDSEQLGDALEEARRNIRKQMKNTDTVVSPVIERTNDDYVLPRPLKKGDEVLLVNINKQGTLIDDPDKDGNVMVRAGIISTRTNVKNLRLIEDEGATFTDKNKKKHKAADYRVTVERSFKPEIDVRGMNGEDAWFMCDKYLDDAKIARINTVTILHGKGTGALRAALWKFLRHDPRVKGFRQGVYGEGDAGVTVVELK